jgi:hypothetical protein
MDARADWEINSLFIVWLLLFIHAVAIRARKPQLVVWQQQAIIAALSFALLPVINFLTSDIHLGQSLIYSNWMLASFDVFMFFLALIFTLTAFKLKNRHQQSIKAKSTC